MKKITLNLLIALSFCSVYSQSFTDINAGLLGVSDGKVEWGDYDNDNDLDFYLIGTSFSLDYKSGLYENNEGDFEIVENNLKDINSGLLTAAWGDYDNDNDLDIIIGGGIYNNNLGVFTKIDVDIIETKNGSISWGDYDSDNDLDILITGHDENFNFLSIVYRNDNNNMFTNINANLTGVIYGTGKWGDFDNDNDLDLIIIGAKDNNGNFDSPVSIIYENRSNVFYEYKSLIGLLPGSASWGDYDNDNDLDLLISGEIINEDRSLGSKSIIYDNDNGNFVDSGIFMPPLSSSFVDWVDFNEDGNLDAMLTGEDNNSKSQTLIYINNGDYSFTKINHDFVNVQNGYFDWRDYNNDNKKDLIISGEDSSNGVEFKTIIYRQDAGITLNLPTSSIENKVFPNPFSNNLNIDIRDLSTAEIDLCDTSGKKILSRHINNSKKVKLNTKQLVSGIYFLRIITPGNTEVIKIIKE